MWLYGLCASGRAVCHRLGRERSAFSQTCNSHSHVRSLPDIMLLGDQGSEAEARYVPAGAGRAAHVALNVPSVPLPVSPKGDSVVGCGATLVYSYILFSCMVLMPCTFFEAFNLNFMLLATA